MADGGRHGLDRPCARPALPVESPTRGALLRAAYDPRRPWRLALLGYSIHKRGHALESAATRPRPLARVHFNCRVNATTVACCGPGPPGADGQRTNLRVEVTPWLSRSGGRSLDRADLLSCRAFAGAFGWRRGRATRVRRGFAAAAFPMADRWRHGHVGCRLGANRQALTAGVRRRRKRRSLRQMQPRVPPRAGSTWNAPAGSHAVLPTRSARLGVVGISPRAGAIHGPAAPPRRRCIARVAQFHYLRRVRPRGDWRGDDPRGHPRSIPFSCRRRSRCAAVPVRRRGLPSYLA